MKNNNKYKNKKAVALKYKENKDTAPRVIAKGKGEIAQKIIETGEKSKIQIYEDENLIEDLLKLELYDEIPPELYEAVAEVILFVYSIDKGKGDYYEKQ